MDSSTLVWVKNRVLELLSPIILDTDRCKVSEFKPKENISVLRKNFRYITHSSFNVAYVENEEVRGYFRECRVHCERLQYVENLLNDYLTFILEDENTINLKEIVLKSLKNSKNLNKFFSMGVKNDFNSPVAAFLANNKLFHKIGLAEVEDKMLDDLSSFIQFAWGEIYLYNMSSFHKRDELQMINANKQIATYVLACRIGAGEIIPKTSFVVLDIEGIKKIGTLMDVSPGQNPEHISFEVRSDIDPKLQCQFNKLHILDIICRQRDHRPGRDGNYNIYISNGKSQSVSAFDNDAPTSFFPLGRIDFTTSAATTPFVNKDDIVQQPFISKECIDEVKNLEFFEIKNLLGPYLSNIQIYFLKKRITKLIAAINKSDKRNDITLLRDSEWSNVTVNDEIAYCESYNVVTYMYSYINLL